VAAVQDCRFYLSRETVIVIRSKVNAVISNKGEEKVKMALYTSTRNFKKMNMMRPIKN